MTIVTGYLTTQDGTTAPTDIGSIFSTGGSTITSYLLGTLQYIINENPATASAYSIDTSNNTITITQNSTNFLLTVPQTGLYLITANLNQTFSNIGYFFTAVIPNFQQNYNISYCSTSETSGSVIIPVTSENINKTITLICQPQSTVSAGATITFQISYISSL
jgi:hypothetical protein